MREILFRGKRVDNGEWVTGDMVSINGETFIYCVPVISTSESGKTGRFGVSGYEVDPSTVGEYTGLTDKEGLTKIFEYDIIDANGRKVGNYYENSNLLKDGTCFLVARMGTKEWSRSEQEAIKRGCKYAE
jgi:hypothetical protein